MASSSTLEVSGGDSSVALQLGTSASSTTNYGILQGDLTIAGTVSATADTTTNTATGMYGLLSYGKIDGDVKLESTGTLTAYGN